MVKTEIVTLKQAEVTGFVCDVCGMESDADSGEGREFFCVDTIGGYDSVFGDATRIQVDICQHCFKTAFGKYARLIGPEEQLENFLERRQVKA